MVLKNLDLVCGFLLYLKSVKVQRFQIAYVYDYYSFCSTTILWKILYLILFKHIKQILLGIPFGAASRVNRNKFDSH